MHLINNSRVLIDNFQVNMCLSITYTHTLRCITLLSVITYAGTVFSSPADKSIRIGVLAHRGNAEAERRWIPTANYLTSQLKGYVFEIIPLNLQAIKIATQKGLIHFILTNPGNYADLEARFGISRIATLQTREGTQKRVRYGAVIFTRADKKNIQTLRDLKNKRFMAVSKDAFGGFQMAWRELVDHDINPFKDFRELKFAGFPQDKIVYAVESNQVDAATVRAETFAHMAKLNLINPDNFRILNQQLNSDSPFPVSTRLYPEWPFATLKDTPLELATQVAQALFSIHENQTAAMVSETAGWTVPLDYSSVTELMQSLKIGLYKVNHETSLLAIVKRYIHWFIAAGLSVIILLALNGYITRTNHRLRETDAILRQEIRQREASQDALAKYRDTLEEQVLERTHDLRITNHALEKSRVALRKLVEITSAPELNHQQRLQELLETGRNYFGLDVAVLASIEGDQQKINTTSGNSKMIPKNHGPINQRCVSYLIDHSAEPLDIPDVAEHLSDDSICHQQGWHSYLGVGVLLEGKINYTLEFAGRKKRKQQLSQWDHEILKVMAQWIADELERQMAYESQRRHETEFARVSRMSTIGEMAASLAHELNQPLTGTINYSNSCLRMLKDETPDTDKITQGLKHAVEGATMAADIIRHIRHFVQKDEALHSVVDLNEAVNNAATLISHEIQRQNVKLVFKMQHDLPLIEGNLIQIEQVILNLMLNGIEAMDRIKNSKHHQLLLITELIENNMVRLIVIDSGHGLPENQAEKIFDPFFSTKNKGMGIGLSISRSIIETHQGNIQARSLGNSGTELSFELPVMKPKQKIYKLLK